MRPSRALSRLLLAGLFGLASFSLSARAFAAPWPANLFVPVVVDQGETTDSGTTLSATWSGPILFEMFGGVENYDYTILRDSAGGPAVVPWTSVGRDKGVTRQGLTLSSGTTYYFAVRAHHISGMASGIGYSDGITFKPKVDPTPPTPPGQPTEGQPDQDVSADGNYTVYWAASSDPESGIASYELWERVIGANPDWHALAYSVTETKFVVTNRPRGQYYYAVFARNGAGLRSDWSPVSDGISVEPSPPLQFDGDIKADAQETSAVITWKTNIEAKAEVDYGLTAAYGQLVPDSTSARTHQITLTGLTPGTTYHFRVRSFFRPGEILQSGDRTFETRRDASIPSTGVKNFDFEGADVTAWWFDEYASTTADQAIRQLADTGADWVGLIVTWYMDSPSSNVVHAHPQKTPTDESLIHAIREAKKLKRKVFLKLHLNMIVNDDPYNQRGGWKDGWAGNIQPANRQAWFDSYTAFATHYAALAQREEVDLFGFGTDLYSMTAPYLSNGQGELNVEGWNKVIQAIRGPTKFATDQGDYTGKLTYAANGFFGEHWGIPFWDSCDYLGLDAYPWLHPQVNQPSLDQIINNDGWRSFIIRDLRAWSAQHGGKKVLFTEIGYRSIEGVTYQPGAPWDAGGPGVENQTVQKWAYDATFLALQKQPWFAGMFWWDWLPKSDADIQQHERTGYTPQGKAAQQSLVNFYLGVDPSTIASIEIVDQQWKPLADVVEIPAGQPINLYAVAKDAAGKILGFAPSAWTISGAATEIFSNDVGFARVSAAQDGQIRVIVQEPSTKSSDAVTLKIVLVSGLPVPSVKYPTIQSAANAAKTGETIVVAPGTYREKDTIRLAPGVSLVSEAGPLVTIIDATGYNTALIGGELVKGFTIRNAKSSAIGRGFENSTRQIINNILERNGRGINLYQATGVVIANNVIRNNTTQEFGGGIRLDGDSEAIIVNNVIINNESIGPNSQGGGIYISNSHRVVVRNNIVMGNKAEIGPAVRMWGTGEQAVFEFNDFWGPGFQDSGLAQVGADINADPKFVNAEGGDYHLQAGSRCINAGHQDAKYNDKDGSRNDMGVYGGPYPFPQ